MKKLAFIFLLLFAPAVYSATNNEITQPKSLIPNNPFEKLGNKMKLKKLIKQTSKIFSMLGNYLEFI